jgi:hypothetical protein
MTLDEPSPEGAVSSIEREDLEAEVGVANAEVDQARTKGAVPARPKTGPVDNVRAASAAGDRPRAAASPAECDTSGVSSVSKTKKPGTRASGAP